MFEMFTEGTLATGDGMVKLNLGTLRRVLRCAKTFSVFAPSGLPCQLSASSIPGKSRP